MMAAITSHFVDEGWTIRELDSPDADFAVTKSSFIFVVACIESKLGQFKDPNTIVADMSRETSRWKRNDRVLVYILHDVYRSWRRDLPGGEGPVLFLLEEIPIISGMIRYERELPLTVSGRELALLERDMNFCMKASDRFEAVDDLTNAILWANRAVQSRFGFSRAYTKLLRLLLKAGDLSAAEAVGQRALEYQPQNQEVLGLMRTLALTAGDAAAVARIEQRLQRAIAEAREQSVVLRPVLPQAVAQTAAPQPPPREPMFGRKLWSIFRRSKSRAASANGPAITVSEAPAVERPATRLRWKARSESYLKAVANVHSQTLGPADKVMVRSGDLLEADLAGDLGQYLEVANATINRHAVPANVRYAFKDHWSSGEEIRPGESGPLDLCLIGTSNGVFESGYVQALRSSSGLRTLSKHCLGFSSSALFAMMERTLDFSQFDICVLDFAPNDAAELEAKGTSAELIRDMLSYAVRRVLQGECLPALFVLPILSQTQTQGAEIVSIYQEVAEAYKIPLFDGYRYLASVLRGGASFSEQFRDNMHVHASVAIRMMEAFLAQLLPIAQSLQRQNAVSGEGFCYDYVAVAELCDDLSPPNLRPRTSSLYKTETATVTDRFDGDLRRGGTAELMAIAVDWANSSGRLRISSETSAERNLTTAYSGRQDFNRFVFGVSTVKPPVRIEAGKFSLSVDRDKSDEGKLELGGIVVRTNVRFEVSPLLPAAMTLGEGEAGQSSLCQAMSRAVAMPVAAPRSGRVKAGWLEPFGPQAERPT